MHTVKTLAQKLLDLKEIKTRENRLRGDSNRETFVTFDCEKEPDYKFQDIVREAHLGELPNDFAYESIADILQRITESANETAQDIVDYELYYDGCPSNWFMLAWLSENLSRTEYIDEYKELNPEANFWDSCLGGIAVHYEHIANTLISELQKEADRLNEVNDNE